MVNFPTSLDNLQNPTATNQVGVLSHSQQHRDANDILEALEAKVGADGSAVQTSHDFKLGEVTGADKAVGKSATQTLTNKTLTSPVITNKSSTGTDSGTETLENKTLTTPTIASMANANHNHENSAGGGQLNATNVFNAGTIPTIRLGSGSATSSTYLRGDQTWETISINTKFGGSGSDGALSISSGTTTLDLGGASYYEKNYTSISITGTGQLAFSNPNANGTVIVLKSQGAVTLTSSASPAINATGMGSAGGAVASGTTTPTNASVAYTSSIFHQIPANSGSTPATKPSLINPNPLLRGALILAPGVGGGGGGDYSGTNGAGGPGGASLINNGGSNGGGGGNTGAGSNGAGGGGGGALMIECNGAYTNTSSIISTAGLAGGNSTAGEGAGGGGGAGTLYVLYNTLVSDTGTYTVTGGAKGTGANSAQDGGVGATSYSYVGLNTLFT
jgi:hypothetical protein